MADEEISEQNEQPAPVLTEERADDFAELITDLYNGDTTLQEVVGIDEETVAFAQQQAYKLYANGRYEKAEPLARGVVALDNTQFYPNMLLGDILFQLGPGVSENATEVFTDTDEETTRQLTLYEESRDAFERAHDLDPEDEFVRTRLAELYLTLEQDEEAASLLEGLAEDGETEETKKWAKTLLGIGQQKGQ